MRTSPHSPEEVERYRALAENLLTTRFNNVANQLAKGWGVAPAFVGKFLKGNQHTLSERSAKLLCELAGEHYPLPSNGKVIKQSVAPASTVRRQTSSPDILGKVLDLFDSKWGPATSAAALALKDHIRDMEPEQMMGALGELSTLLKGWEKKYSAGPEIDDPESVLRHK